MPPSPLKLGSHLSVAGGLHNALLEARRLDLRAVQLFVANQRQWRHPPLPDETVEQFQTTQAETGVDTVIAHGSYLVNLCAVNPETAVKSREKLTQELLRCDRLGVDYLVMHPGAHMGQGEEAGLIKIATVLQEVMEASSPKITRLLLETTAGQGTNLGHRFAHLGNILDHIGPDERFGICLDTCHVFAAGYDLQSERGYAQTMDEFDRLIGLKRLKALHLNDSKHPLGSHKDRHEHIGKGCLGKTAFANLINDCRISKLPMILETPKGLSPGGRNLDKLNLATLRRLYRG